MKTRQPTMAELMVGTSSSSDNNQNSGMEKAAAQAQVGEIFEGLTKEAKDDLVGTMGWAGRVFGEQISQALAPQVEKLASIVAEIKEASKARQENAELTGAYNQGTPHAANKQPHGTQAAGKNPGGLPGPAGPGPGNQSGSHTNAPGHILDTEDNPPGDKGWPTEGQRHDLAKADVIHEQKSASQGVLAHLQGAAFRKGASVQGPQEEASLSEIGAAFGDRLRADLNKVANG